MKLLWTAFSGFAVASPAVADGLVYVNGGGMLRAFDAAGNIGCSGTPKTCVPVWTAAPGESSSSAAVANGVVYVGSGSTLFAYEGDGTTGCSGSPTVCVPLWTAVSPDSVTGSSPAVANGVVYIGFNLSGGVSTIYAFDAAGTIGCSGAPRVCAALWTADSGSFGITSPAVVNGVVYVSDEDRLRAFKLQ